MEIAQKVWKPTKKQSAFLSVPNTVFEALYGGEAGGGKTELLLMLPLVNKFTDNTNFRGILFCKTYQELMDTVTHAAIYYIPSGATFRESHHSFAWPNGAKISFGFISKDADINKYLCARFDYVAFDNISSFSEAQYKSLVPCCRSGSIKTPAIIRATISEIPCAWVEKRFQQWT